VRGWVMAIQSSKHKVLRNTDLVMQQAADGAGNVPRRRKNCTQSYSTSRIKKKKEEKGYASFVGVWWVMNQE
jgi:hypothetical protein